MSIRMNYKFIPGRPHQLIVYLLCHATQVSIDICFEGCIIKIDFVPISLLFHFGIPTLHYRKLPTVYFVIV